jgi:hypothetical protein
MRVEDLWSELNACGEDSEDDGPQLLPNIKIDQFGRALLEAVAEDLPRAGQRQALEGNQGEAQLHQIDERATHQQSHQPGLITLYLLVRVL